MTTRLERSQAARRARVLEAVLELLETGGTEAVQLRPLTERTGVGSDTIYRYFGSRDALIAEAVARWCEQAFLTPAVDWAQGSTAAERLLSYCEGVARLWRENPNLMAAMAEVAAREDAADGIVARSVAAGRALLFRALDGVEDPFRTDVVTIIETVSRGAMTALRQGAITVDELAPTFERAVRRLAQHPAMDGHRPRSWDYRKGR